MLPRRRPVVPVAHVCVDGASVDAIYACVLVVLVPHAACRCVETETNSQPVESSWRRPLLPLPSPAAARATAAAAGPGEALPLHHWLGAALTGGCLGLLRGLLLLPGEHLLPSKTIARLM